ncbi:glycosyltransferase family 2 protein [Sphingomonas flavalba]|uniref:glycosyltransferase family 2 protein n=1 Tax=Sphingomonas flavalba TaxID=2559804 RepID=UPI00109DB956|nr:glycosyltransferase family 2 protein [Sphingomonas flavalba]
MTDAAATARDGIVATPLVSLVLVSWNTCALTMECLASIAASPATIDHEIVLVDNGSVDGTAAAVRAGYPTVRVVRTETNLGFAGGANSGAAVARGEFLLFLNTDTIVSAGAIDTLVAFALAYPEARLWGGRTINLDGSANLACCWAAPTLWSIFCISFGLTALFRNSRLFNVESYGGWQRDSVREVAIISGCFLLIGKTFFDSVGRFDDSFFLYGEDADLCFRARLNGARPRFTPHATVTHLSGASSRSEDMLTYLWSARLELIRRQSGAISGALAARMMIGGSLLRYWRYAVAARRCQDAAAQREVWKLVWTRRALWSRGVIGRPLTG